MKKFALFALLLVLPAAFLAAQSGDVYAELIYYDFGTDVEILIPEGEAVFPYSELEGNLDIGLVIPVGATIVTNGGSVEITLVPNGSVMKLAPYTEFTIESLSASRSSGNNDFTVATGSIRTVASRLSGNAQMRVRSSTSVAGVRGTDFSFDADSGQLFVQEGLVEFGKLSAPSFDAIAEAVSVPAGQFADAFSEVFQSQAFSPEQFAEKFSSISNFSENANASLESVPTEPEGEASSEEATEEEAETADTGSQPDTTTEDSDVSETPEEPDQNDMIMEALGALGMEIGSITIDGETYSKAVFQPEFALGKLKTQLYLPIVYTSNLLDPDDWYRPDGNDEWSFGTDDAYAGDYLAIAQDALTDFILKFKYIEWGDNRDSFFFQVGNIESMTLGHGILIRGYANDADFPAIRRVGLNTGFATDSFRFQALVNDLADPYLYGARLQLGGRAGLGFSVASDVKPYDDLLTADSLTSAQQYAADAKPMFFNAAVDFDLPIMENGLLSIVFFGDAGALLPYLENSVGSLDSGFQFQALYNEGQVKNWGVESGVFGNVLFVDYRLQYQYYTGTFKPGFYNQPYDRIRSERATEVLDYLLNPSAAEYNGSTMGVFGEGGFSLFDENLTLDLGYLWPWSIEEDGSISNDGEDYFTLEFAVNEELLDFLPWAMSASLEYNRYMFRDVFTTSDIHLFDETATLKGEALVEVAPGVKLAVTVGTSAVRDTNGNVSYDSNGRIIMAPVVGLTTVIGY